MESTHTHSPADDVPTPDSSAVDSVALLQPSEILAASRNAGRRPWPLCVFFGASLLIMLMAIPIVQGVGTWWDDTVIGLVLGSILGSVCVLCAFSGLWGRSWLAGYVLVSLLTAAGCICFLLGEQLRLSWQYQGYLLFNEDRWIDLLIPAFFCPLFALAGIAPLLLLRGWAGWQLTRPGKPIAAGRSSGVEELLIGTTVAAAALMIARSGAALWEIPNAGLWLPLVIFCLIIASASLIGVVPAVWISTRVASAKRRRLFLTGIAALSIALACIGTVVANWSIGFETPTGNSLRQSLLYGLVTSLPACAVFLFGLLIIRLSGYQFHAPESSRSAAANSESPLVDPLASVSSMASSESPLAIEEGQSMDLRQFQWRHRLLAGGLFGVAVLCSLAAQSALERRADELWQLQEFTQSLPGRARILVDASEKRLLEATLDSADDLERVETRYETSALQRLSFAGGRFGDEDVEALTRLVELQSLDLSDTQISDAGLVALVRSRLLVSLRELNLSNTPITPSGIEQFLLECNFSTTLDMRGLPIDCGQLAAMPCIERVAGLKLGPDQVTDESLAELLVANDQLNVLDVSGCPVTDKAFVAHPRQYSKLILDGTFIDGPGVLQLLGPNTVDALSLREIELDVTIVKRLLQDASVDRLELSDLRPADTEFQKAGTWSISNLTIRSPQFDASCFARLAPQNLQSLDLSGSGVTDAVLVHLDTFTMLQRLNLANTAIGDAGLKHLAKLSTHYIDLRGTQVTPIGLIQSGLTNKAIYLNIDQFSSTELQQIRQAIDARIGEAFPDW